MEQRLSRRASEALLALVVMARATGYLFSKLGMTGLGIFNLLALRFLIASMLLSAVFAPRLRRIDRRSLRAGLIMGGLYFLVMSFFGFSPARFVIPMLVMVLVPMLYSYLLYRRGI